MGEARFIAAADGEFLQHRRLGTENDECKRRKYSGDDEYTSAGTRCPRGTDEGTDEDERAQGEHNGLIDGDIQRRPVGQHNGGGRRREWNIYSIPARTRDYRYFVEGVIG